jgi:hypothetical protein
VDPVDPDPDPSDPHVFGPLGSGSGSFHLQAKIVRKKNLDSYCFVTSFGLFIVKNDVNVPSKSNEQKNFFLN